MGTLVPFPLASFQLADLSSLQSTSAGPELVIELGGAAERTAHLSQHRIRCGAPVAGTVLMP